MARPRSVIATCLRLALLAPDIVEAIVAGRAGQLLMLEWLERPLPVSSTGQHQLSLGRMFS
jgi:hypothetical protein